MEQLALSYPAIVIIMSALTRWLSHDAVTDALSRNILPVLAHLYNVKSHDVPAYGLYSNMCDYRFLATLVLMRDVLPPVAQLSCLLQHRTPDYGQQCWPTTPPSSSPNWKR